MNFSISIRNYKCFGENSDWIQWKPITILIGKNNSGKSSIIEVLQQLTLNSDLNFTEEKYHRDIDGNLKVPEVFVESVFEKELMNRHFPKGTSGGSVGMDFGIYGESYVGTRFVYRQTTCSKGDIVSVQKEEGQRSPFLEELSDWQQRKSNIGNALKSPLLGKVFHWIVPEREITPESKNDNPSIKGNGKGLTNAIQTFLNHRSFDEKLVEKTLLSALNKIFSPDHNFTRISTQHLSDQFEIFIEDNGRKIALSNCGTGIKTVFLILGMILLQPKIEKKQKSDYVFAFEELENNLHPQLLRRLLSFITDECLENRFSMVLTTHSNVTIDFFSNIEESQIYHIKSNNGLSQINSVQTFFDSKNVLTDLDVRASDLLQSNGVIWVEGPSDRILLNQWISSWGDNQFHEGIHYQILFYGGRLLSHLSGDTSDTGLIKMLSVNSNAAIVIDSDKRREDDDLNSTKKRLIKEFEEFNGFVWVTQGREIENYYPNSVVSTITGVDDIQNYHNYNSFFDNLDAAKSGEGKKYSAKKPELATKMVESLNKNDWEGILDLNAKMTCLVATIKKWNNL